jgi:predicted  nucleic acid-binding Zn-ribbon protein
MQARDAKRRWTSLSTELQRLQGEEAALQQQIAGEQARWADINRTSKISSARSDADVDQLQDGQHPNGETANAANLATLRLGIAVGVLVVTSFGS